MALKKRSKTAFYTEDCRCEVWYEAALREAHGEAQAGHAGFLRQAALYSRLAVRLQYSHTIVSNQDKSGAHFDA